MSHEFIRLALARKRERGQSLIEFAFLMPLVLGMLFTLRDINMVISALIVNAKYSRAMMHSSSITAWYPEEQFIQRTGKGDYIHRWWVGVQDPVTASVASDRPPVAPTIPVGRYKPPSDDDAGSNIQARQNVRIRASSFVCLPPGASSSIAPTAAAACQTTRSCRRSIHVGTTRKDLR